MLAPVLVSLCENLITSSNPFFRIDQNFVIKVADFGLSEDIYCRNYFKQTQEEEDSSVKLPIRWMALECLLDGIFTEKTDVVSLDWYFMQPQIN